MAMRKLSSISIMSTQTSLRLLAVPGIRFVGNAVQKGA